MSVCGGFDLSERDVAKPDYMDIRSEGLKRRAMYRVWDVSIGFQFKKQNKKTPTLISHLFR